MAVWEHDPVLILQKLTTSKNLGVKNIKGADYYTSKA